MERRTSTGGMSGGTPRSSSEERNDCASDMRFCACCDHTQTRSMRVARRSSPDSVSPHSLSAGAAAEAAPLPALEPGSALAMVVRVVITLAACGADESDLEVAQEWDDDFESE